jgi:SAM-dependent methyltransferase
MSDSGFDRYSASYDELLRDPLRDFFTKRDSEAFYRRKRDVFRRYFRRRNVDTRTWRHLDVGCGRGELLALLRDDFAHVTGCDPSAGMLGSATASEARLQEHPTKLPCGDGEFDFVSAVCVYHHVPLRNRLDLTREISRVLKPGGVFAMVEHNPWNPVTRLIVSRTPVDGDAVLLTASEARGRMRAAGFHRQSTGYFLYLPESFYQHARFAERSLAKVPLGGQYVVFGVKPAAGPGSRTSV